MDVSREEVRGYYLDFQGVRDKIFRHLCGQNKRKSQARGSADYPDPPPADAPAKRIARMFSRGGQTGDF